MKDKLNSIIEYLNKNYSQDSDNYSIFNGSKPAVIRYDNCTAISMWSCGAIVCIDDILHFLMEDDGNWFIKDNGVQDSFSIGWIESFSNALNELNKYVIENGTPVYYKGITEKIICNYELK